MKKALISPNESQIQYISGWTETTPKQPMFSAYPNSCRVAEVCDAEFEVAAPLFWVDCANDVVAEEVYFDTADQAIKPIVNTPRPTQTNTTEGGA